jgi:hypothetical protein
LKCRDENCPGEIIPNGTIKYHKSLKRYFKPCSVCGRKFIFLGPIDPCGEWVEEREEILEG